MQTTITSTEAVRNFSELLNNIKYRGDRYTVIRGGKPAASLVPVEPTRSAVRLVDLGEIMRSLPHLDSSDKTFEADVIAVAEMQPSMPEELDNGKGPKINCISKGKLETKILGLITK